MRLFISLVLVSLVLLAQSPTATNPQPQQFTYAFNTGVISVATSSTAITVPQTVGGTTVYTGPIYICSVEINANGQAITLTDGNSKPYLFNAAVIGSSGTPTGVKIDSPDSACRYMPNGILLSANATGATATLIIKHN